MCCKVIFAMACGGKENLWVYIRQLKKVSPGHGLLPGGGCPRRTALPLALFGPVNQTAVRSPLHQGGLCNLTVSVPLSLRVFLQTEGGFVCQCGSSEVLREV